MIRDRRRSRALISLFALFAATAHALRAEAPPRLAALEWLLGEWQGVGDQAGATGGFTFALNVQDHVILRTNYSNTPASGDRPASRHDDLMVIYVEGGALKADYFDSEAHVIRYTLETPAGRVVFVSDATPLEPRYRLTYIKAGDRELSGQFDVAPPGRPTEFAKYLTWSARRIR